MTEREVNGNDLQILRNILRIPQSRLDIPDKVLELYEKAQYAKHACGQPGGFSDVELRMFCLMADAITLPQPVACKFGELVVGTPMWFRVNKYEIVECQFVAVQDAARHTYKIRLWGEIHSGIPENALYLEDPRGESAPKVSVPTQPTRNAKAAPPVVAPATEEELQAQEQRIDAALAKMKERWPVGKHVDCCVPGEPAMTGIIQGYDRHGNVMVRPDNGPADQLAWVSAEHLFAAEPITDQSPVAPTQSAPLDNEDNGEDSDDADTGVVDFTKAFPKGMTVAVSDPPGESFTGQVLSHGNTGRWTGLMKISPSDGSAARWVKAKHVRSSEPANV